MEQTEPLHISSSIKNIQAAVLRLQSVLPVITKKGENPHFRSKYAEYPDIQKVIRPFLMKEEITTMFFPVIGSMLILRVTHNQSNEFIQATMDLKTIQDSPQAQGSAITYGKRYMITAFFDLIIEDASDDDGNAGSAAKAEPAKTTDPAPAAAPPAAKAPDTRPFLNPNSEVWFNTKIWLFTIPTATMEKVTKKYRITKDNQVLLAKQEDLKPGNKYWPFATVYLATEGNSNEAIVKAFNITENDLQDLQIDATNYTPAEKPQPAK